jgi:arylsulfatase A-like enzyme
MGVSRCLRFVRNCSESSVMFMTFSAFSSAGRSPLKIARTSLLIVADDLGWGELGCYGQTKIATPHLDALAKGGVRMTRAWSGAPECAPSRCVLFTGRHMGHAAIRDNAEVQPEGQTPLPKGVLNIFEAFGKSGWSTGCIGKWGLGPPGRRAILS